jgi:hypothetical protein
MLIPDRRNYHLIAVAKISSFFETSKLLTYFLNFRQPWVKTPFFRQPWVKTLRQPWVKKPFFRQSWVKTLRQSWVKTPVFPPAMGKN